jgi:hypothetical protein
MVFLSAGTATRALGQDEFRRDRIGTDVADGALAVDAVRIEPVSAVKFPSIREKNREFRKFKG